MCLAAEPEAEIFYKKPLFGGDVYFFYNLIREVPIEENTTSECILTVAAT